MAGRYQSGQGGCCEGARHSRCAQGFRSSAFPASRMIGVHGCLYNRCFFPTCQVRVVTVDFIKIVLLLLPPPSPPPRPPLLPLPRPLLPCQLFANFGAQCALLDLNLGPSQLSAHRWTSTWGLPSSVRTAGPQKPNRMPEDMPDRMSDRMREDMPDKMP